MNRTSRKTDGAPNRSGGDGTLVRVKDTERVGEDAWVVGGAGHSCSRQGRVRGWALLRGQGGERGRDRCPEEDFQPRTISKSQV